MGFIRLVSLANAYDLKYGSASDIRSIFKNQLIMDIGIYGFETNWNGRMAI
uniref:hypothetical protein n=1 Tax=Agathobacter sp. TaxID=2021311 RepID=UPI004056AB5B